MSQTERDLWPDDLHYDEVVPPVIILREQAALLGDKTKGLVVGDVESIDQPAEDIEDYLQDAFGGENLIIHVHTLFLVARALDNYRYSLLSVSHDFEPYPCRVQYHPDPESSFLGGYEATQRLPTQGKFLEWLQVALSRPQTKRVIYALISRIEKTKT